MKNFRIILVATLFVAVGLVSCNPTNAYKAITNITLDKDSLVLEQGTEGVLQVTIVPNNATDKYVIWSSSNYFIAEVTNGVVRAVSVGTAYITAQAEGQTATCKVIVKSYVKDIKLDKDSIALNIGQQYPLKATVTPDNAKDNVVWSSSNNNVAKVTADGVVEAVSVGTANIFAKAGDKTAICKVMVSLVGTNWTATVQYGGYPMLVSLNFSQSTFTMSILGMGEMFSDTYIYEHPAVYFYDGEELMVTGQVDGNKMILPDFVGLGVGDITFTKQ